MPAAHWIIAIATILAVLFFRFLRVGTTAERVWRERREELEASRVNKLDISKVRR